MAASAAAKKEKAKITVKKGGTYGDFTAVRIFRNGHPKRPAMKGTFYGCVCVREDGQGCKRIFSESALANNQAKCLCLLKKVGQDLPVVVNVGKGKSQTEKFLPDSTRNKLDENESYLRENWDKIQAVIDSGDFESGSKEFLATTLSTIMNLLVVSEDRYREFPTQGAAVAFNQFVTQAREIMNEINAEKREGKHVVLTVQKILQTAFLALAKQLLERTYELKQLVNSNIPQNIQGRVGSEIDEYAKRIGRDYQNCFEDIVKDMKLELKVKDK